MQVQRIGEALLHNISPRQEPNHPNLLRWYKVLNIGSKMLDSVKY